MGYVGKHRLWEVSEVLSELGVLNAYGIFLAHSEEGNQSSVNAVRVVLLPCLPDLSVLSSLLGKALVLMTP